MMSCSMYSSAASDLTDNCPHYRFIPPVIDPDKSNIKNSENTALFLVSCFEYILSGVVLNAGPPFRQGMWQNCELPPTFLWLFRCNVASPSNLTFFFAGPFVATITVALLITLHMVAGPVHWFKKLMELTKVSWDFKLLLLFLGAAYLVLALVAEKWVLPAASRGIGRAKLALTRQPKKRKEYKLIQESMHA